MDFFIFLLFFPRKKARKNPQKNPPQNSPGTLFGKIPSDFCRSLFLTESKNAKGKSFWKLLRDRYDWTTGVPDNGNDWRKFRAVPRSYPLAFPCFVLRLIGLETKNVLDYQGRAGDHFHCTVERSPRHIRCRTSQKMKIFAEDISEDLSEARRDHFYWI